MIDFGADDLHALREECGLTQGDWENLRINFAFVNTGRDVMRMLYKNAYCDGMTALQSAIGPSATADDIKALISVLARTLRAPI